MKGHGLSTELGCPLKKFPPVGEADYAVERKAGDPAPKPVAGCCGDASMPPLSWGQVLASFAKSMVEWIKAGVPLVDSKVHGYRHDQCRVCDRYHGFYCTHCKCVAYLKTKLATEQCPLPAPRWLSATGQDE